MICERANIVDIKRSRVGKVKVGQAMAWERSGEDTEVVKEREIEEAVWMERGKERERERLVPGWEKLRCEL